jgi:hypothetical protein
LLGFDLVVDERNGFCDDDDDDDDDELEDLYSAVRYRMPI